MLLLLLHFLDYEEEEFFYSCFCARKKIYKTPFKYWGNGRINFFLFLLFFGGKWKEVEETEPFDILFLNIEWKIYWHYYNMICWKGMKIGYLEVYYYSFSIRITSGNELLSMAHQTKNKYQNSVRKSIGN